MIRNLQLTSERVALEAFIVSDLAALVKKAFPQILDNFKDLISFTSPVEAAIALTPEARSFMNNVARKHSYVDIAPMSAWVPEGFNSTYLDYVPSLQAQVDHADGIVNETLGPFVGFLAKVLTNYDDQIATQAISYTALNKVREALEEDNAKHYRKGSTKAQVSVGDVIKRNSDWETVLHNADQLSMRMNKVDRKALNKKLAEATDLMDRLIKQIKAGKMDHLTPEVVTTLSNGAFQVAKEIEFYSIVYYRVLSFTDAVSKTVKNTQSVLTA